jgi:hypothetical protein
MIRSRSTNPSPTRSRACCLISAAKPPSSRERIDWFVFHFEYTANELAGKDEKRLLNKLVEARGVLRAVLMDVYAALDDVRILPKYVGTIERAGPKP